MEKKNLEQHYAIKFCVKLGQGATDIYQKIQKAFGNDPLSRGQVFRWNKDFVNGREMIEDEPEARLCETKHKRRPCEGFHSSRSTFDNSNDRRLTSC
jgi:hypothetical protein